MDSAALLDLLGNENRRRILRLLARKPCYVTEISEYLGVSPKAVIDHLRKLEESGLVESHVDDGRRKYFSIARNLRLEVNVSPYDFGTKSAYSASPNLDIASWRYVSLNLRQSGRDHDAADGTGDADEVDADAAGEGDVDAAGEVDEALEAGGAGDVDAVDEVGAGVADPGDSGGDADPDVATSAIDGEMAADPEAREPEEATVGGDGHAASGAPGTGSDVDDLSTLASDLRELERLENELSMAQRWVQGRLTETLDRISAHFEGVDGRFYAELLRGLATGEATAAELSRRVEAPPDVVEDALEGLSAHGVVEQDGDHWELD